MDNDRKNESTVVKFPNPLLTKKCQEITKEAFSNEEDRAHLKEFVQAMSDTLDQTGGIGLAANQVQVPKYEDMTIRVVIVKVENNKIVMINPEVLNAEGKQVGIEGCLSLPGVTEWMTRYQQIKVKYLDIDGNEQNIVAIDQVASCVQHEMDHLDGLTMLNRMSRMKRDIWVRKMKKRGLI